MARALLLAVNAGSSNTKLALYDARQESPLLRRGMADGGPAGVIAWLGPDAAALEAIGHRVVWSLARDVAEAVTPALLAALRAGEVDEPDHLPQQLALIEGLAAAYPKVAQVVCSDSAFHRTMPRVARLLAIPRRFDAAGVQRVGFHGLSCAWLMEELRRIAGAPAADGRVIIAHLGSGASVTAVAGGESRDTSMGFTPAGGLPMATRSGDIDPGVLLRMLRDDDLDADELARLVNHESGLLGISGTTGDMRALLARESEDPAAAEAVEHFCYQTRKWIGAFAAVLGGVDTLIFSGGIGEHSAEVRDRACAGLAFLGLAVDPARNAAHGPVISTEAATPVIRVIPTNEEWMIAQATRALLAAADAG